MKHWILTRDRMQTIITNLDLNRMTLKAAKLYYSAYGVEVKGNTKAAFIKNLAALNAKHLLRGYLEDTIYEAFRKGSHLTFIQAALGRVQYKEEE